MVKELPVMLLVMMLAFFRADPPCQTPTSSSTSAKSNTANGSGQPRKPRMVLQQPEKVMRIHDYYMHKLQVVFQKSITTRMHVFLLGEFYGLTNT